MLSAVLRTIGRRGLFEPGTRALVAVSGGPDSMALLHLLWEARDRLGIALEVVGVNHGLRPAASGELDFVATRADALDLRFSRIDLDLASAGRRGSLQDAARRARLCALAALADDRAAARGALGHQADDQAETVLFRIVRGTGLRGLAGIPYRRGVFVRPLLDVPRAEILDYLRRRSISFIEDPSNADFRFARARVRHQILPALRAENPRVAEALIALGAAARGEAAALPELGRRAAAAVDRIAARGGSGTVDVAGGRQVIVAYGRATLADRAGGAQTPRAPLEIDGPGKYRWSAGTLTVRDAILPDLPTAASDEAGESEFDADRVRWPLIVRARRPGDRMRPRGGRGTRKLSDLMIDAKIVRVQRPMLPVVTGADGEVLFVPGLRPAEAGRPNRDSRRLVRLGFRTERNV